jgi:endo-1,4-beta-xylanase
MIKTYCTLLLMLLLVSPGFGAASLATNHWELTGGPANIALQTVPAVGTPGGNKTALQVTVLHPSDPFWNVEISQAIHPSISLNHLLRLTFWARSVTHNPIRAVLEQAAAPYQSVLVTSPTLTPQWQEFTLVETNTTEYGPNGVALRFQVGQQTGTIEITGVHLLDLGIDPAIAQAQAAIQPSAVQARIRRYRMADLTVVVRDAHGRPVPNAHVHIAMTRHAFLFGANIFNLSPQDTSPIQLAYQKRFADLFNYATLPFYWGAFEPQQDHPDYERLDAMTRWCIAHGITPKGHPLVWHQVWPSWAPKDAAAAIPLLHKRVTDLVTHYRGQIHYWDAVNEANSPDTNTGEGAWIQQDGAATVVGTVLGWARAAGRGADDTFTYNDYNTGYENVALLTQLQQRGELPDVIGIQSHMHDGVWPMTKVWRVCQRFAAFGIPLHFTEITVLSGPKRVHDSNGPAATDWLTTPDGEAAQAQYVTQFYTLLFSHPSLHAITWWDLSDLNAWQGAPAGLLRKDMTPKPAYTALMTLIHKTWWTNEIGRTDKNGRDTVHAFYGNYKITVTDSHGHTTIQTLSWPESSGPCKVVIVCH